MFKRPGLSPQMWLETLQSVGQKYRQIDILPFASQLRDVLSRARMHWIHAPCSILIYVHLGAAMSLTPSHKSRYTGLVYVYRPNPTGERSESFVFDIRVGIHNRRRRFLYTVDI